MKDDFFKQAAKEQCLKSTYKQRVGAVVVNNGKMVGKGYNKVFFSEIIRLAGRHAEIEALKNTTAKLRNGCTVYVCRFNKVGGFGLAKPCIACQKKMKKFGVKYVWYSTINSWERMIP